MSDIHTIRIKNTSGQTDYGLDDADAQSAISSLSGRMTTAEGKIEALESAGGGGGSGSGGSGLDSATRAALADFFSKMALMIPKLAFTDASHNGTATATAASAAAVALEGVQYTVTNTLSHCRNSNSAAKVTEGRSYTATLSPDYNYTLGTVTVTMGGTDITSSVCSTAGTGKFIAIPSVTGNIVITATATASSYTVINTLTNCANSNTANRVNANSSYSGTITADSGYTLLFVTVYMGGTNITSSAYDSGTGAVSIASVTGNVAISARAGATVSSISAAFSQNGATITTANSLDDLKQYLTVTATYSNNTTDTIISGYTLSGTLAEGTNTITVTYQEKTATFTVTVSAATTTYTVTNTLSHCTNSNSATSAASGNSYSGTLTASTGYALSSVTVTMGGTDITSSAYTSGTGVISIASITGNIVITASASVIAYTVTNTLSNCANSNTATSANYGSSYSGTITASSGYTLDSVTVTMGGTDITSTAYNSGTGAVSIASVTGNIVITASAQLAGPTLSSIGASFNSNGETLYECIALDTLKQFLTVTATYSNSSTATVSAENYTLSGTLAAGSNTVTVSYGGQTTTFTVTLTALELSAVTLPSGYTQLDYVESDFSQYITLDFNDDACDAAEYGILITAQNSNGRGNHIFSSYATYFPFLKYSASTINSSARKVVGYMNKGDANHLTDTLGNTISDPTYNWELNTKYVLSGYPEIKINHVTIAFHQAGTGTISKRNFRIFDFGGNANATETKYRFSGRLYFLRVYLSGALVHNYVPCKNSSDVAGLYDTVGETFVSSATSTALIAGNVVTGGQA